MRRQTFQGIGMNHQHLLAQGSVLGTWGAVGMSVTLVAMET